MIIQQGHLYEVHGHKCIALEGGNHAIRVSFMEEDQPWPLKPPEWTHARLLKPLPMRYFHMETPQ